MSKALANASTNIVKRQATSRTSHLCLRAEASLSLRASTPSSSRNVATAVMFTKGRAAKSLTRPALVTAMNSGVLSGSSMPFSTATSTESTSSDTNTGTPSFEGDASWATSYLEEVFPSLFSSSPSTQDSQTTATRSTSQTPFPPDLAARMLTHMSYTPGAQSCSSVFSPSLTPSSSNPSRSADPNYSGHNARLAFLGRRVLTAYYLMFLQSSIPPSIARGPRSVAELARTSIHRVNSTTEAGRSGEVDIYDFDALTERALETHALGARVGEAWGLENSVRWTSAISRATASLSPTARHSYERGRAKVFGTTVEAVVGGIFHQFGGLSAHSVFNSHVLPFLEVPELLRGHATEARTRLGSASQATFVGQAEHEVSGTAEMTFAATIGRLNRRRVTA